MLYEVITRKRPRPLRCLGPNAMTVFLLLLLGAYLIGAIPSGVVLTRLAGVGDVRQAGSGNIGSYNFV